MSVADGHVNGVDGKSTFRPHQVRLLGEVSARIVTPRWVVRLTSGRELIVYAPNATVAQHQLAAGGFDSYERAFNGCSELRHVDVSHADVDQVHQEGGRRADGGLDFGAHG